MKKEERLRREGMAYALRVAKEKGIEALESDMKARGILELPLAMKNYDGMRELYNMLAMRIVSTIKTTTLWTLYDKYGWRKKRIGDFEKELNRVCADCLELDRFGGSYVRVSDYAAELKETCDVDLNFEILSQIDEENTKARGQYISVEAVAEILRNAGLNEVADEIIRKVEENR
jgi:hypothetical protein|uniref:Uncharacterized protein n=1 Tax=Siphoviridae sp. ctNU74 TaxID=2825471 RepID=A0A8S5NXK1_9CAUD|nr:MAG TPA: hypothetical protein [Siphoviridae sp. ctNU74]